MSAKSAFWYLSHVNLFTMMSTEELAWVEAHVAMREVRRKTMVYATGDPADSVYVLKRGVVKISSLQPDGHEILLALLRAGEVFGEEAVLDESPRDHSAEAHEDALVCVMRKADFLDLMRRHAQMAFQVTKLIGLRFKTFRMRVEQLLFKGAPARLALALLELAREHGVQDSQGVLLNLRLSQADLANLVGLSRESVNMALADFRRQGLVIFERRSIRLPMPDALAEYCARGRVLGPDSVAPVSA